jgi:hypothetical protein
MPVGSTTSVFCFAAFSAIARWYSRASNAEEFIIDS